MTVQIVFQNKAFVVAYKESGWLSVPSRQGALDERLCLGLMLQAQLGVQIFPVHRLDEPVSGLVLFALHSAAHRAANRWFEKGLIQKTYQALSVAHSGQKPESGDSKFKLPEVQDLPILNEQLKWESVLSRGKKRAYSDTKLGKKCVTYAKFKGLNTKNQMKWLLKPQTGRPHQLRYELFSRGWPIVGDALYGSTIAHSEPGIELRMIELDFKDCSDAPSFGLPSILSCDGLPDFNS